jgi:hypothetical protein
MFELNAYLCKFGEREDRRVRQCLVLKPAVTEIKAADKFTEEKQIQHTHTTQNLRRSLFWIRAKQTGVMYRFVQQVAEYPRTEDSYSVREFRGPRCGFPLADETFAISCSEGERIICLQANGWISQKSVSVTLVHVGSMRKNVRGLESGMDSYPLGWHASWIMHAIKIRKWNQSEAVVHSH